MEDTALLLHLLGAFSLVAGSVLAKVTFETARGRQTPAEIALVLGFARLGVVLVVGGLVLVVVFGLWLVDLGSWGTARAGSMRSVSWSRSRCSPRLAASDPSGRAGWHRDSRPTMRRSAMSCARC